MDKLRSGKAEFVHDRARGTLNDHIPLQDQNSNSCEVTNKVDPNGKYFRLYFAEAPFSYYFFHTVLRLLVTANVVPTSSILLNLMMEAMRSSETSVLTKSTPC
jgi:hypothetical protein